MKKINYKQITSHFFAIWFYYTSITNLANIYYVDWFEIGTKNIIENAKKINLSSKTLTYFLLYLDIWSIIGILIPFIISLIISQKNKWSKINSLIVLLIFSFFVKTNFINHFLNLNHIQINWLIKNYLILFITRGIFFLILGSFFFFSKPIKKFIQIKTN